MEQLIVRDLDPEVARYLEELAHAEGVSLSEAALRLMRRGAGLGPAPDEGLSRPRLPELEELAEQDPTTAVTVELEEFPSRA